MGKAGKEEPAQPSGKTRMSVLRAIAVGLLVETRDARGVTIGGPSTCSGASRRAPDVAVRRGMDRFSEFELRLLEN